MSDEAAEEAKASENNRLPAMALPLLLLEVILLVGPAIAIRQSFDMVRLEDELGKTNTYVLKEREEIKAGQYYLLEPEGGKGAKIVARSDQNGTRVQLSWRVMYQGQSISNSIDAENYAGSKQELCFPISWRSVSGGDQVAPATGELATSR